ncbi:hypothetical protein [Planomonospora sp. ID82291]|uniref:hypothetical protein n=1 Tax=Planomonospora sp. ID82291 TaxID=2738136 RepID=UPI0018C3AED3|nr:hypothetical protein [Planomonospora sp. ID82291]MBG0819126.1 hypothetical protein [Planomonospora sp. ID82291]
MSQDMADYLRGLGGEITTWQAAVLEVRAVLGGKAADVLADAFSVQRRTAERWIARAEGRTNQSSDPTRRNPGRAAELIAVARNRRAANKLRAARKVKAGKVRVRSKSPVKGRYGVMDPRPRNIGDRPAQGILKTALEAAADLVQEGEYGRAAALLDDGVMEAYGVPEGTLEITSYLSPPEIE